MASLLASKQFQARFSRNGLARSQKRVQTLIPRASLMVKDPDSGVEFPVAQTFWQGETMRCLGPSTRSKKILIVSVQVYSVAAFMEADKCAKELGVRGRGGFFENDDDYMTACMDGAFDKTIVVHLVRDVDGPTFAKALNDTLVPRMTLAGELPKLKQYSDHISGKNLVKGTEVVMLWNIATSTLEVSVVPPGGAGPSSYSSITPELKIESLAMCRSMFETFMGEKSVVPLAKAVWVKGAKALLESDNVKRNL